MAEESFEKPGAWRRFRRWLSHLHFRIVTIEDTPHSIALGAVIVYFVCRGLVTSHRAGRAD